MRFFKGQAQARRYTLWLVWLYAPASAAERRLMNVVEEMALAAMMPVPKVYLLPDGSINAFAAGTTPANAVIGVTRGALQQLDRAQLQAVVAHEFSHIANGDMRLNMRLTGWLFGLQLITVCARWLMFGTDLLDYRQKGRLKPRR